MNLFHTAVLRHLTGDTLSDIEMTNAPGAVERFEFPSSLLEFIRTFQLHGGGGQAASYIVHSVLLRVLYGFVVPMALCYHAASYVVFPLNERLSSGKHLQLMTGLKSIVYWASNFVFDFALSVLHALLFTLAMLPFRSYLHWIHVGEC